MKIDHILLDSPENPLPTSAGYNWIGGVDSRNWDTTEGSAALLLVQLQENAHLFEAGGYIEDFDGLLYREMEASSFSSPDDAIVLNERVGDHLAKILPGLTKLDYRADTSLLLSIYGKVCSRLPGVDRAVIKPQNVQAGTYAFLSDPPTLVERIRSKFTSRMKENVGKLDSDDVAAAAIEVVAQYTAAIEEGRMSMTSERAMAVKWLMLSLKTGIENEFPEHWNPVDEPVLIQMNEVMGRFEDAVDSRLAHDADVEEEPEAVSLGI